MYNTLIRSFYEEDPLIVTKNLLGKLLVRRVKEGEIIGRIVETEAYIGPYDKASHAYNNKMTRRTLVQFGERGHAYVFKIYGMYYCFCAVVGPRYIPAVALIRSVEPVKGIETMRRNRRVNNNAPIVELTNGPSKVCQAFEIATELNGVDLCSKDLSICEGDKSTFEFESSKRIGINYAEEYRDVLWRFYIKENKFVSKKQEM